MLINGNLCSKNNAVGGKKNNRRTHVSINKKICDKIRVIRVICAKIKLILSCFFQNDL